MTSNLPIDPKGAAGALKTPLHLIPPPAIAEVAKVLQLGAKKYHPWNWRMARVFCSTYVGAIGRHMAAWWDGEDLDPESGLSHVAHAAASALIVLDAMNHGTLELDRPPARLSALPVAEPSNPTTSMDGNAPAVMAEGTHRLGHLEALPAFLPVKGADRRHLPHSTDAMLWAGTFVATVHQNPSIATDVDTMLGWFANAIMAGYDEGTRRAALHSAN